MHHGIFRRALIGLFTVTALVSCGNEPGSGVSEFRTVTVSATAKTTRLESDVLSGNTCSVTGSSGGTFVTDNVDVDITSALYPNATGNPSPVFVDKYTVSFVPANASSPALASLNGSIIGTRVNPGSSTTLSLAVAPDSLKVLLVNQKNLQLCSQTIYEYFATITFEGVEEFTGVRKSFATSLNVAFADRSGT